MDRQLIFIGCSPRTGSTLLTRILNCHSQLAAPCEIMIKHYFTGDRAEGLAEEKHRIICEFYGVDVKSAAQEPTLLFRNILEKENKKYLVIKHPRHSIFFEKLRQDYPRARIVHLVRDARSVAMTTMYQQSPQAGLIRWYKFNTNILDALKHVPTALQHRIYYEALVDHPTQTMVELMKFLGLQFAARMLNYGNHTHADDQMCLWNDGPPLQSPLHQHLRSGTIDSSVKNKRENYSQEVHQHFEQMIQIKTLNHQLGY